MKSKSHASWYVHLCHSLNQEFTDVPFGDDCSFPRVTYSYFDSIFRVECVSRMGGIIRMNHRILVDRVDSRILEIGSLLPEDRHNSINFFVDTRNQAVEFALGSLTSFEVSDHEDFLRALVLSPTHWYEYCDDLTFLEILDPKVKQILSYRAPKFLKTMQR
ncbi:hypothetical protein A3715_26875 [Oleiphilus sp. HI0009]|nr:hypothetical protein A3715_18170 [Oleiphilus sp. HI0009]KZX86369.1 hypothetical protein A3715_26875 [Oleiphilus sp. HI0009]